VDTSHNITYALAQNPDAIIVNLPTNDAANMYALSETETNLQALVAAANTAHVPIWISTSQPRNNLIQSQYDALTGLRNWVLATYGTHGLDFWTTVANPDGTIKTAYNGDGTHFNDAGHKILYQRVVTSNLLTSICATTSITGEH
jgi:lysophospholipase L1-like esterase